MAFGLTGSKSFLHFSKVDKERREVWGLAQIEDDPDLQGDVVDFEASVRAFTKWANSFGNVREMHEGIAAGKCIALVPDEKSKSILVGIHVSKGAEDTWQKVLDGTLQGFSIGGRKIRSYYETDKSTGKKIQHITEYELQELSLVDSPANPACVITAVYKSNNGRLIAKSMLGMISRVKKAHEIFPRTAAELFGNE